MSETVGEWTACAACRFKHVQRLERFRADTAQPIEVLTFTTCERTGWSLDYERSASGTCGPGAARFEERPPEPVVPLDS